MTAIIWLGFALAVLAAGAIVVLTIVELDHERRIRELEKTTNFLSIKEDLRKKS